MLRSLRARLLLAILGVAAVSLALAGWLFSRVTVVRFEEFQAAGRQERPIELPAGFALPLEEHYRQHGGWSGVAGVLPSLQEKLGQRFILLDAGGNVAGVSSPELQGARVTRLEGGGVEVVTPENNLRLKLKGALPLVLKDQARAIGELYPLPLGPQVAEGLPGDGAQDTREFPLALNRSLASVVLLVLAVATVVALWLTRKIVAPVESLTAAVEKMRAGDLRQHVPVEARDEIGELGRAFNALSEQLARVEQLRRDMVSDVAHELRTPLTNIRAQLEAMQDGLVPQSPAALASLHEETLHLARLVDDLRDLSLADAGQLKMQTARLEPVAALEHAIAALRARATERSIRIERNASETLPDISADAVRLGQILRNLLENAIRHTPPGGHITVQALPAGRYLEISVTDTGPGIAPEHLPKIFERFYRTDPSRTRKTGGAGLGLAIVKQLVSAQGGEVRAESAPGAGATFVFSLPLATA